MIEVVLPPEQGICSLSPEEGIICPHVVLVVDADTGLPVAKEMVGEADLTADWERRCSLSERNHIYLPVFKKSAAHLFLRDQTDPIKDTLRERAVVRPMYSKSTRVTTKSKLEAYTLVLRTVREEGNDVTYALFSYAYMGPRADVEGGLMLPGGRGEVNEQPADLAHRQLREHTGIDFPSLLNATEEATHSVDGITKYFYCVKQDLREEDPESIQWSGPGVHLGVTAGVCWVKVSPTLVSNIASIMYLSAFNDSEEGAGALNYWHAHVNTAATLFLLAKHAGLAQQVQSTLSKASIFLQRAHDELDKKEKAVKKVCEDEQPALDEDLGMFLVVTGFPKAEAAKLPKLKTFVKQRVTKTDEFHPKNLTFSTDADGNGDGMAFVEYESVAKAKAAVEIFHGASVGRSNVLSAGLLSDFDSVLETEDAFVEPELNVDDDEEHLSSYLLNEDAHDQFVTISGDTTFAFECGFAKSIPVMDPRPNFTEKPVAFSPHGSYLVTFLKKGVALWGKTTDQESFRPLKRFAHDRASLVDFSPDEKYIVTFSNASKKTMRIWNVESGTEVRSFSIEVRDWPVFKWSHDSSYCARKVENGIIMYDVKKNFRKLDNKNIVIPRLEQFSWCPNRNLLCYHTPEYKEKPFRLAVMAIPKKEDVVTRNMIDAKTCNIHWQKDGQFLCAHIERMKGKRLVTYLELFHVTDKSLPYDHLEIQERVIRFQWEPIGDKFSILVVNDLGTKFEIRFYQIYDKEVIMLQSFPASPSSVAAWAPTGRYCLLATLHEDPGELMFLSIAPKGDDDEKKGSKKGKAGTEEPQWRKQLEPQRSNEKCEVTVLNKQQHDKLSHIQWDPTARYVVTSVRASRQKSDNGYKLWTFTGRRMREEKIGQLDLFKWRPRPKEVLGDEELSDIESHFSYHMKIAEAARAREVAEEDTERMDWINSIVGEWEATLAKKASTAVRYEAYLKSIYKEEEMVEVSEEEVELLSRVEKIIPH